MTRWHVRDCLRSDPLHHWHSKLWKDWDSMLELAALTRLPYRSRHRASQTQKRHWQEQLRRRLPIELLSLHIREPRAAPVQKQVGHEGPVWIGRTWQTSRKRGQRLDQDPQLFCIILMPRVWRWAECYSLR